MLGRAPTALQWQKAGFSADEGRAPTALQWQKAGFSAGEWREALMKYRFVSRMFNAPLGFRLTRL